MIITLTCTGSDPVRDLAFRCKDKRFVEKYGDELLRVDGKHIYPVLAGMADWVNNELHEQFLIEVD